MRTGSPMRRSREWFFYSNRKYELAPHKFQKSQNIESTTVVPVPSNNLMALQEDRFIEF